MPEVQARTLEPILSQHPFFQGIDRKYLALLSGCASNVVFHPQEYLMREGEPANHFYILRQGRVSIEIAAPGQGTIPLQTVGEGEILGWSWIVPPYRWHFDGRAVQLTRAIALDAVCLRDKCEADHDLGYDLLKRFSIVMSQRMSATRLQLLDLYGINETP